MSAIEDIMKIKKKPSKKSDDKVKITKGDKGNKTNFIKIKAERREEAENVKKLIEKNDNIERIKRIFLKELVKDLILIDESKFLNKKRKLEEQFKDNEYEEDINLFLMLTEIIYYYDGSPEKARKALLFINDKLRKLDYIDTNTNIQLLEIIKDKPKLEKNLDKKFGKAKELYEKEYKRHQNLSNQLLTEFERKKEELTRGRLKDMFMDIKTKMEEEQMTREEKESLKRNEIIRYELLNYILSFKNDESEENLFGELDDFIETLEYNIKELEESKDNNSLLFSQILKLVPNFNIKTYKNKALDVYKKFTEKVFEKYNNNVILACLEVMLSDNMLKDRYNFVLFDGKTMKDLYGPFEEFVDFKNLEKISNDNGIKLIKKVIKEESKESKESKIKKPSSEFTLDGITYYPLKKDLKSELKVPTEYKKTYLDKKSKDRNAIQKEQIELYMKNDNFFPFYNKSTQFLELNEKDIKFFRSYMKRIILNYFDENSSELLENNIFNNTKDLTLHDYIKKIASILIFTDEKYMKNIAKLFNQRLSNQYFNLEDLSNLSIKEILYDIYNDSSNTKDTIDKLNENIEHQLLLFELNVMQKLTIEHAILISKSMGDVENITPYMLFKDDVFSRNKNVNPYVLEIRDNLNKINNSAQLSKQLSKYWDDMDIELKKYYIDKVDSNKKIYKKEIRYINDKPLNLQDNVDLKSLKSLNIDSCNLEYKNSIQYKRYNELQKEYNMYKDYKKDTNKGEDEELIKISKELEKASKELERYLKDIIYYKDRDDNKIYCFSLFELLEEINNKNYINVYNNKPFSEDFINYVKKHKKPSVKSIVELKEGFKELVFDSINNLDMSLMSLMSSKTSKDLICKYYNDYVFSKTEFEERLKKTDIQIEKLKNYCESKESNEDVEDEKDKKDLEDEKNDQVKELKQNKKIKLRDLLKDKSSLISSKSSSSSKVSRKLSGTRRRSRIKNLIKDE